MYTPFAGLLGMIAGILVSQLTMTGQMISLENKLRIAGSWRFDKETPGGRILRLRKLLTEKPKYLLPAIIAVHAGILAGCLMKFLGASLNAIILFEAVFAILFFIGHQILLGRNALQWEVMGKRDIASILFRFTPLAGPVDQLLQTALPANLGSRENALASFQGLIRPEWHAKLLEIKEKPFVAAQMLAESLPAALEPILLAGPPLSVQRLHLFESFPNRANRSFTDALRMRANTMQAETFEQIYLSQFRQLASYPHVFCMACRSRARKIEFMDAAWLQCLVCADAVHLQHGVEKVIGQIGGDPEPHLEHGVLKINLWDAEKGAAIAAAVDRLEIVAGQPIDYNWAVIAVIDDLRNQHLAGAGKVHIDFVGKPKLDENTLRMLQQEGFQLDSRQP